MRGNDISQWERELGDVRLDEFYDAPSFSHPPKIMPGQYDDVFTELEHEVKPGWIHAHRATLGWFLFYGVLLGIMLLILI